MPVSSAIRGLTFKLQIFRQGSDFQSDHVFRQPLGQGVLRQIQTKQGDTPTGASTHTHGKS